MKKSSFTLVFIFIAICLAAQSDWMENKYFIKYKYGARGSNVYKADNPYEDNYYGFSFYEYYSESGNNFEFGYKTSEKQFFVIALNVSSDSYIFALDEQGIESNVSLLTISPYFGLKHFFFKKEKIATYFQLGAFNRFSFAKTDDDITDDDQAEDFEQALEDATSPARILLEFGAEYFFNTHLSMGISFTNYFEFLSGKAFYSSNGNDFNFYEFEHNRFGQFYNLNLIVYF